LGRVGGGPKSSAEGDDKFTFSVSNPPLAESAVGPVSGAPIVLIRVRVQLQVNIVNLLLCFMRFLKQTKHKCGEKKSCKYSVKVFYDVLQSSDAPKKFNLAEQGHNTTAEQNVWQL
jgi:hypothetical protein